eukprot:5280136-Pyramimonas_sp.AAC.1
MSFRRLLNSDTMAVVLFHRVALLKAMPDYILGKHSSIGKTLAFYMNPPVCALSPGIDSPPEWGMLARRSSGPTASRSR